MKAITARYRELKSDKVFFLQVAVGFLFLGVSLFLNNYANNYTTTHTGLAISDLILDHLPVLKVDDIFYEGALIFIASIFFVGLHKPARIPFILKAIALFICIRSFFMILTHLAPPLHQTLLPTNNFLERLAAGSGEDLFFSGHTGLPFLMCLIFWKNFPLRLVYLGASLVFGIAALLGHLHYSIDVFSAFFISFGIFHLAAWLFKKDYRLLEQSI